MMYYLHHLSGQFIGFNVFLYVTFRAIAAAVTAFLTTLIFGNFIIAKLRALKVEQPIRGAAEVHRLAELQGVKQGTPTMGGVLVIGAVVVSSILWARLDNKFVWLALFSMVYLGGLGFADDYLKVTKKKSEGIHGRIKLAFPNYSRGDYHWHLSHRSIAGSAGSYALRAFHQNAGDCEHELVHLRVFCAGHRRHIECGESH